MAVIYWKMSEKEKGKNRLERAKPDAKKNVGF
jgi:hypothetical protein